MQTDKILVKTESKKYPIYFGNGIIKNTAKLIKKKLINTKKIAIIADKNLSSKTINKFRFLLKKYEPEIFRLVSTDKLKNIKAAMHLAESLLRKNFNRSDCVIALGGGVIGDLSAFVSCITKRGIKFVNIPTTLLAQVDASIGGKTAINSKQGKNLIGTFYQPEFVIIDVSLLKTLPRREMIGGYAEILKHSLIQDKKFFNWLTKNGKKVINKNNNALKYAIIKSCKIKAKVISLDEKEKNIRMILNFGHTFGHAFEATKKFSKKLIHGEAVMLGMIIASEFSMIKKILPSKDYFLIKNHYDNLNLPMNLKKYFNGRHLKRIIYFMSKDKKNFNKKINLILLKKIGTVVLSKKVLVTKNELGKFLTSKLKY